MFFKISQSVKKSIDRKISKQALNFVSNNFNYCQNITPFNLATNSYAGDIEMPFLIALLRQYGW